MRLSYFAIDAIEHVLQQRDDHTEAMLRDRAGRRLDRVDRVGVKARGDIVSDRSCTRARSAA
jgi:hypothetical protein